MILFRCLAAILLLALAPWGRCENPPPAGDTTPFPLDAGSGKPGRFQAAHPGCTLEQRRSGDVPAPTCCIKDYLTEIWKLRADALGLVQNAISKLAKPKDVEDELWANFRVKPGDSARIGAIKAQFQGMAAAMQADDVLFLCRDHGDPACAGNRRGVSLNCSSAQPRLMLLCGDLALAQIGASKFLGGSHWLHTVVHEYAHIGCLGTGGILPEGKEFYQGQKGYPPADPDTAIKNADSYASFASAVKP